MNYRLILFDLDWTLARPSSGATFRHPGEPYVWLEGAKELLETFHAQGVEIAVAVNQGGIGFGRLEEQETRQAIHALLSQLTFPIPWLLCPYFPQEDETHNPYRRFKAWRKPAPGMLLALAALYPHIEPEAVLCVGDRREDYFAAQNAGFDFLDRDELLHTLRQQALLPPPEEEPSAELANDLPF
jgi:HAD superfamily hydrolase (TIGR01662 family)